MKINVVNKWKVWVILTLLIIVVGAVMICTLGFNKSVDMKQSYEVDVHVDQNIKDDSGVYVKDVIKTTADELLDAKSVQEYELGYIYKLDEEVDVSELSMSLGIATARYNVTAYAEMKEVVPFTANQTWRVVIAIAVSAVLGFIVLLVAEKSKAALTGIAISVLSILLNLSICAICRIPVSYAGTFVALTFVLTLILSAGILNRFSETAKLYEGLSKSEIADKCVNASILRFAFVLGALLVASLLFIVLGSANLRYIGLELIVSGIIAVYSGLILTPTLWANVK